jgi:type IV pilus assembly protein PilB
MNAKLLTDAQHQQDQQVVDWLSQLLSQGLQARASDIHLEPYESLLRIRMRIDGWLHEMPAPPAAMRERIISRIKVLSKLDIAEKRLPQDGRLQMRTADRLVDVRVSTLPTVHGEKAVLRILDVTAQALRMTALGLETIAQTRLIEAISRPHGLVLITGPTGSGKTVTLYTCLEHINSPKVNIATVEDPAEIMLPGINQVNVNEKLGLNFASALRSLLRQDPDILMVGEIRDLDTADMAVKASQTGHLVLSTLHTNDAPSTLIRLRQMGIAPFNIASSITLISAQRLVRRLCAECKVPVGGQRRFRAVGCPSCQDGYAGRIGIHQVMPISEEMQAMMLEQAPMKQMVLQAEREGVQTLRDAGLAKVSAGETTLEEVMGATHG